MNWVEYSIAAIEVIIFYSTVGNISIGQYFSDLHIFHLSYVGIIPQKRF
ncbi:hypothetical protein OENI_250006 [Oenococcus oeni]|nr:hypothetical protein OENI_250006 [Oenococcus oeni]